MLRQLISDENQIRVVDSQLDEILSQLIGNFRTLNKVAANYQLAEEQALNKLDQLDETRAKMALGETVKAQVQQNVAGS